MCLIAFAWQAHPDYPLVVAANRDEYFARPTRPADWWEGREILAGRDLRGGGTWMGVTATGRFAALTNYRDPASIRADAPSRGLLVSDVLESHDTPGEALESLVPGASDYNGFNLLAGHWHADPDRASLWVLGSRSSPMLVPVAPGVHGLSNAELDTPWPKVERTAAALHMALADPADVDALVARLLRLMADPSVAPDGDLPDTGVPRDFERALSAAFIRLPGYGTRTSTVLVVDRTGHATFVERTCEPDAEPTERDYRFTMTSPTSVPSS